MKTFALLIASTSAIKVGDNLYHNRPAVYTTMRHWNEDPHSTPAPMIGGPTYLTTT